MLYGRQCVFQVTGKSAFSAMNNYKSQAQLILEAFRRLTYVIAHSPTLPSLYLRHSSFSNFSFACLASQDFHFRHLASRPWGVCVCFNNTYDPLVYFITHSSYSMCRNSAEIFQNYVSCDLTCRRSSTSVSCFLMFR